MVHAERPVCNKASSRNQADDVCLVRCLTHPKGPPVPAGWGSRWYTGPNGQRVRYANCQRPTCPVHGHLYRRRQCYIFRERVHAPFGHVVYSVTVHLDHPHSQQGLRAAFNAVRAEARRRFGSGCIAVAFTEWGFRPGTRIKVPHLHVAFSAASVRVVDQTDVAFLAAEARVALEGLPVPEGTDPARFAYVRATGFQQSPKGLPGFINYCTKGSRVVETPPAEAAGAYWHQGFPQGLSARSRRRKPSRSPTPDTVVPSVCLSDTFGHASPATASQVVDETETRRVETVPVPVVDPDTVVIPHKEYPGPRVVATVDGILAWSDPDAGAWVAESSRFGAWGVASSRDEAIGRLRDVLALGLLRPGTG